MRVVLVSRIEPAVQGLYALLRDAGHEPVALLTTRVFGGLESLLRDSPGDLDVVFPATRERIAPLLRLYDPDVAFCIGFPWKIPAEALAVPRLGIVNGHPSLLPCYRGPSPVAWAIRNGESDIGFTFHYMDAELDTGNLLAQAAVPLGDEHSWDELGPKLEEAVRGTFVEALERLERDDPGDPQPAEGASYFSQFEPEFAWIDWTMPAADVERQVRAWRFHSPGVPELGALTDLDGETVRVLRVSREPADGPAIACADGTLWIVESEAA